MVISIRLAVLALLSFAASISTASTTFTSRGLLVESPTEDPFYQPPVGFESEAPGTILRNRTAVTSIFSIIPNPVQAYQLLYRTTATNGSAIAAVTTVFVPWKPKTDRFVSFQSAYDSVSTECTPSYQWQLGGPSTDIIAPLQMVTNIEVYLLNGYIVASSDYEGPDAAFGAGHLQGMLVLDGMRAVNSFHDTLGLASDNPMIVGAGYSGAAIATGWAASLHPSYAPELNIKGWSVGGTPANITGALVNVDNTSYSGFTPIVIDGLAKSSGYGAELNPVIDDIFTSKGREHLTDAETQCPLSALLGFRKMSIFSTDIQKLGPSLFQEPTFADVLSKNTMGVEKSETPIAPVFLFHATHDGIVPYETATDLADAWCNNGASVKFTTFDNGGHGLTEVLGLPDVLKFVEAVFTGDIDSSSGCSHNNVLNSTLNPLALGASLEPLLDQLLAAL